MDAPNSINNVDNHLELVSRKNSYNDQNKRYSLTTTRQSSFNGDDHSQSISIISGNRQLVARTPSNLSAKSKSKRKKSSTGSDHTEKSDSSKSAPNRSRTRNNLTASFLRKKRAEYAGNLPILVKKKKKTKMIENQISHFIVTF